MSSVTDQLAASVRSTLELAKALELLAGATSIDDIPVSGVDVEQVLSDHGVEWVCPNNTSDMFDELLDNAALEVYGLARVTFDTVDVRSVVVVTGTGGPHIEFEVSHTGDLEARGYWGRERETLTTGFGSYSHLADRLADLIGGWDR